MTAEDRLATVSSGGLASIEDFFPKWHRPRRTKALQAHRHGQLRNPIEEEDKGTKEYEAAHMWQ